jgi:2-O-methyltransferase
MSEKLKAVRRKLLGRPIGIDKREAVSFLPRDPVILEAGAHIGIDTVELARLWPEGTVHAFEPISDLYRQLQRRTKRLPNVRTYQRALGAATGTMSMWVSEGGDESSSLLVPKDHLEVFPGIGFGDQEDVQVTTIDDWASEEGVKRVDFLWLDMQGHELTALKHASTLLANVRAMILEVFTRELYQGAPLWPEVEEWLIGVGFVVVRENIGPAFGDVLVAR